MRFAEILDGVYRTEETENYGMNVLRIYLKPTKELKEIPALVQALRSLSL